MNSPKKWVLFWISYILAAKRPSTKLICSPNFSFAVRERFRYQLDEFLEKFQSGGGGDIFNGKSYVADFGNFSVDQG